MIVSRGFRKLRCRFKWGKAWVRVRRVRRVMLMVRELRVEWWRCMVADELIVGLMEQPIEERRNTGSGGK